MTLKQKHRILVDVSFDRGVTEKYARLSIENLLPRKAYKDPKCEALSVIKLEVKQFSKVQGYHTSKTATHELVKEMDDAIHRLQQLRQSVTACLQPNEHAATSGSSSD